MPANTVSTNSTNSINPYEAGRRARRHGGYRALCIATADERAQWLRGYDDEDAEINAARPADEPRPWVRANFDRLASAVGVPLTHEQAVTLWWLAGMERASCDVIAHLFERVRAVPDADEVPDVR
jgi:hypothetical protein